jgi:hypothetical protein
VGLKTVFQFSRLSYQSILLSLITCAALFALQCQSDNPITPAAEVPVAMTLTHPKGGESFGITDTVRVRWFVNPDSLNTGAIGSFLRQFSIDSGKSWYAMTFIEGSAVRDSNRYELGWMVLDTNIYNDQTQAFFSKEDMLSKGIMARIVSYPPKTRYAYSRYFFVHE